MCESLSSKIWTPFVAYVHFANENPLIKMLYVTLMCFCFISCLLFTSFHHSSWRKHFRPYNAMRFRIDFVPPILESFRTGTEQPCLIIKLYFIIHDFCRFQSCASRTYSMSPYYIFELAALKNQGSPERYKATINLLWIISLITSLPYKRAIFTDCSTVKKQKTGAVVA